MNMLKCLCLALLSLAGSAPARAIAGEPVWQELVYAPAPADNPLKGLVPYSDAANPDHFPHSMEFSYFPMSSVVTGSDQYDWSAFDFWLNGVAGRGHQAVVRFYTEFPGRMNSVPEYLAKAGLKFTRMTRETKPTERPSFSDTPDYGNPAFRAAMVDFVKAFGARYDGDPRIGFITAGMLGLWGEWHDYPRQNLFADKLVQAEIMDAYEAAFRTTPVLLRYPAGAQDKVHVDNAQRHFGYHDDSFAWSTLETSPEHFLSLARKAGSAAQNKWMTEPIGGEIRPEAWSIVFDATPTNPAVESFRACVDATHVTWLMDSGMFRGTNLSERRVRAFDEVRRMGYEFYIRRVALETTASRLKLSYQIENRGIAPFYYAWPIEMALRDVSGKMVRTVRTEQSLMNLLPGKLEERELTFSLEQLPPAKYLVLMRVPNPLPNGKAVAFANATQDKDMPGWLSLGEIIFPTIERDKR
jgi:hypothetical protein